MSNLNIQIAKNYAESFYDYYKEKDEIDIFIKEVSEFSQILKENIEIEELFITNTRAINKDKNIAIRLIQKIQFSTHMADILFFLAQKDRMYYLHTILNEIINLSYKRANIVFAEIITATQLDETEYNEIQSNLENKMGIHFKLKKSIDSSILGGIVIKIGDLIYDASIKNSLSLIKKKLVGKILETN